MTAPVLALLLLAAPALFEPPAPTGPHAVGTTTWHVTDPVRKETLADSSVPREVEVHAWYPAAPGAGAPAPYLRDGIEEVQRFAALIRGPKDAYDGLANVITHARPGAAPLSTGAKFPVLVFSHGYGGFASASTALLEDLASHGYAVLSVVHPYESAGATLFRGRRVSYNEESDRPPHADLDVLSA